MSLRFRAVETNAAQLVGVVEEPRMQPVDGASAETEDTGDYGAVPVAYEDVPATRFHALVAIVSAGGQFSDGYSLGTIGIALSLARDPLQLSASWMGLLGSASLAGLFFGSLFLGPLADRFGRRPLFVPTMAVFAVVSLLQFFAATPWELLPLRFLLGLMLGIDYVVCSAVVVEFASRRTRGRLLASLSILWAIGYTSAFVIGDLLKSTGPDAWRWILGSGAIPAALIFLVRLKMPESPPWLIQRGRSAEARQIIQRYIGTNVSVPVVVSKANQSAGAAWRELFGARYRRRTAVGAIFYTAQVIPYFALGTFIPSVFGALDITNVYTSGVIFNVFMLAGAGFGFWLVDWLTRRQFLIGAFYFSAAILLFLVLANGAPPLVIVATAALFAFVLSASTILEFVYLPELFPTRLRASGVGFGTAASRIGSACGTFLLPLALRGIGVHPTLGLCVGVLLVGGIACHLLAPETQGCSIEDA
jgi:putative MFS transporter